jgi:hypothetical protein
MTTLADQQRALQRAVVTRAPDDTLLRSPLGREPLLRIYQHAYTARLAAALRDNFGSLPQVMGDEAFDALALAYIAAHPSRHPSIRWFGDRLPEFMAANDALVPHASLVDLARMEWALRQAFDAADAPELQAAALAAQAPGDWPRLVFDALPSVQLLGLRWAIEPVWRAMQSFDAGAAHEPELPEPVEHEHALLIWRQGLDNRWRSVDAVQADLLQAMLDGRDFGALCEIAAQQAGVEHAAATAVGALQSWLADGLLSGVRVRAE